MSIKYEEAKSIMGDNIFGRDDWEQYFGVKFPAISSQHSELFPWDEKVLESPCPFSNVLSRKKIKDTHFAFWGASIVRMPYFVEDRQQVPLNIVQMTWLAEWFYKYSEKFEAGYSLRMLEDRFLGDVAWMRKPLETRWYLMHQGIVASHSSKLNKKYYVPHGVEETAKYLLMSVKGKAPGNKSKEVWSLCQDRVVWERSKKIDMTRYYELAPDKVGPNKRRIGWTGPSEIFEHNGGLAVTVIYYPNNKSPYYCFNWAEEEIQQGSKVGISASRKTI